MIVDGRCGGVEGFVLSELRSRDDPDGRQWGRWWEEKRTEAVT
jgi:hypothetical protein